MVSRSMGAEFLQERASKVDAQFRKIAADAVGRYTEDAVLRAVQKTSFGGAVEDAVKQALVPLLGGDHAFTEEAMEEKRKRQRLSEPQGAALPNAPQAGAGQPGGSGIAPGPSGEAPKAAAVPGGFGLGAVYVGGGGGMAGAPCARGSWLQPPEAGLEALMEEARPVRHGANKGDRPVPACG